MTKHGIYTITNNVTGGVYVGSSVNLKRRFRDHLSALRKGEHKNDILQRAWAKYGEDAFEFSVVEEIADKLQLIPREQHWMDALRSCGLYNIEPNAGSSLGRVLSEETKKKISAAKIGFRHTPEVRARMAEDRKGRRHTPESRAKMSAAKLGTTMSEETKRKMAEGRIGNRNGAGYVMPEERRKRVSEFFRGKTFNLGRVHSEQSRRNMGNARRGKKHSPETLAKITAANRRRAIEARIAKGAA